MAGGIYNEAAYAQGKMLDHSAWFGKLPRGITPSDVDFCFDNAGNKLLCELSSKHNAWKSLDVGQRRLYESFVSAEDTTAVLLKHSVPKERQINTIQDIDEFQVMFCSNHKQFVSEIFNGDRWFGFVLKWFENPDEVRGWICSKQTKAREYPDNPAAPTPEELEDSDYVAPHLRPFDPWLDKAERNKQTNLL